MGADPWQQWQALTAPWAPGGGAPFGFSAGLAAPPADAGARFAAAARAFWNGSGPTAGPSSAAAAQFADFLREQFAGALPLGGLGMLGVTPGDTASAAARGAAGANRDASAAGVPGVPAWGVLREHQERAERMAESARRAEAALQRLRRLWSDVLRDAATAFVVQLARDAHGGPPSADALTACYAAWIDCAEAAYARTAHGEAFCSALADFINASSAWRREFAAAVEHLSKLLDLPTRSEVNTLTRRLQALEVELRTRAAAAPPVRHAARPAGKPAPSPRTPTPRARKSAPQRTGKP